MYASFLLASSMYVHLRLEHPLSVIHRPAGATKFGKYYVLWQGGGVVVGGGTVNFNNCNIHDNQASNVSDCFVNLTGNVSSAPLEDPSLTFPCRFSRAQAVSPLWCLLKRVCYPAPRRSY